MRRIRRLLLLTLGVAALVPGAATAGPDLTRTDPDVERPLKWLIAAQNDSGGWGPDVKSPPDVATTAIAGISLVRLGHTAAAGQYQASTRKAIDFVARAVEKTPKEEVAINAPGTLPQMKLGRYIDTFLGAQFLSEALPSLPQGKEHDRVKAALQACVSKIERAQRADGSFSPDGWAGVLSDAFAAGGLHGAKAAGAMVSATVEKRAEQHMLENYDASTHRFRTQASAGVELYTMAGTAEAAARTGQMSGEAAKAAMGRLSDENFIRGFGTYGGEEHVSYMMTSEALATISGKDWERWDRGIRLRLAHIQRDNGTWRGDHCITSTSFCTAASLITLTVRPHPIKSAHQS
jgi:prenyltransferase/squalene oxidase-like repeat protein